jgi:signal transduction histidine kinase
MSHSDIRSKNRVTGVGQAAGDSAATFPCPLPVGTKRQQRITSDLCIVLGEAGCPLAFPVDERLRFETLLANLSATFVNVPANQVDSQIVSALRQMVELLELDRCGFGEMSADRNQLAITHSYELAGVPPSPRIIVEEQMPWYARAISQGEPIRMCRLPDDLPPEAIPERYYCIQSGLKSQLTIPLKVTGAVVGGIGFASYRSHRDWPDELVQRLRLVGDIFTNALARKRAEEALQRATAQAAVLLNQLAHATRLELVSHLTTSIAHEVNQPLCAIASNAQTAVDLLGIGNVEEAKKALQDIWADAKRASNVVGRVRGMVKKEEPCRTPARLASVIEELAPLLLREATARGVVLRIELDTKDLTVVCDRVQLQQVLLNLLLNAVDAVADDSVGPPEVVIRAWAENASWALVSFEDTGIGLAKEDCERVFAPFFTTKAKGLGMGLNISRSLIAAHGGSLWATPGLGHGTTFHVRLPVASGRQP